MNANVLGGFVMAGVGILIAMIGSVLYCFCGIGCPVQEQSDLDSIGTSEAEEKARKIGADGNPRTLATTEEEGEA
jgi:hypothetical protein